MADERGGTMPMPSCTAVSSRIAWGAPGYHRNMHHHLHAPIFVVLLLAAASAHCATTWVKIADTDQSSVYLDSAVSQKVGDNVMVWLLRDHTSPRVGAAGPYLSSRDQVEVDCRGWRVRRIYSSDHPKTMGEGRFFHSEHGPMSWNAATPSSVMGRAVELACVDAKGKP